MVGLVIGIEILAATIFTFSILYFRNPVVVELVGNFYSLTMVLGLMAYSINRMNIKKKKMWEIGN